MCALLVSGRAFEWTWPGSKLGLLRYEGQCTGACIAGYIRGYIRGVKRRLALVQIQQAKTGRFGNRLLPASDGQLAVDIVRVPFHCADRNEESVGDFLVA